MRYVCLCIVRNLCVCINTTIRKNQSCKYIQIEYIDRYLYRALKYLARISKHMTADWAMPRRSFSLSANSMLLLPLPLLLLLLLPLPLVIIIFSLSPLLLLLLLLGVRDN